MVKVKKSSPAVSKAAKINSLYAKIEGTPDTISVFDQGKIISLGDGIAWVDGLDGLMYGEVVNLKSINSSFSTKGLALNLETNKVGILVLEDYEKLAVGDVVTSTGRIFEIGVGEEILGRVVDVSGKVLDGKEVYKVEEFVPVEKIAPGVIDRSPVDLPLQTGIKAVDAVIPIGRGQRELIIGDRGTGKTALAVDAIINQKDSDVICIYVAIGQKRAKIAQVVEKFSEYGVMAKTVVVVASASDSAAARYLAPYSGCAIGEYFMGQGKHVLIVYDDLSKHAWAYREISLLLRRPSGREAYPGDVFYLHSKLLERACQLSKANGGGSLTALPIIETQAGDVSAYIPTNVISITDGQIYLEGDLFFSGVRPAVSVGLSVSRVGGAAQIKAMKKISGRLKLDLSQYWELATFAQFATDLDAATAAKIERGKRIIEILKQPQYLPMPIEEEILSVYLVTSGALDEIAVEKVSGFEKTFLAYIRNSHKEVLDTLNKKKEMDEKLEGTIKEAIGQTQKLYGKS